MTEKFSNNSLNTNNKATTMANNNVANNNTANNNTANNNATNNNIITKYNIPKCNNAKFYTEGEGDDMEFCANIFGVGTGCQKFDRKDGHDPRLAPFGIFGSYVDSLEPNQLDECMEAQGETLSKWGLCDAGFQDDVKGFGYKENEPRLKAIKKACQAYETGHKNVNQNSVAKNIN